MKKLIFLAAIICCIAGIACSCGNSNDGASLPRGKATAALDSAFNRYLDAVTDSSLDLHSIMVVKDGKVVEEKWMSEGAPDKPHVMWSVSKSFTATAVGLAISEGKLRLDDKMTSFFPDDLPEHVSDTLAAVTIKDLLTMSCGHGTDPTGEISKDTTTRWEKLFMQYPFEHMPGEYFCYNSLGTYMLSSIVTKVTGEKVVDYLTPRLFEPLGIDKPEWEENFEGVNCGGWGLHIKTEDMAKFGLCLLQGGKYRGKQVIPAEWVAEASARQIDCRPAGMTPDQVEEAVKTISKDWKKNSDWIQGYGYQMWRCRNNGYRADGMNGQFIIMLPDKNAVIAITANISAMQKELNQVWEYIYPAL